MLSYLLVVSKPGEKWFYKPLCDIVKDSLEVELRTCCAIYPER